MVRLLGLLCGFPECCVESYERSSKKPTKKQKRERKVQNTVFRTKTLFQKALRKIQVKEPTCATIIQFWPCKRCAPTILREYKRTGNLRDAFEPFVQRPWSLDTSDLPEDFDTVNDHAFNLLIQNVYTDAEYRATPDTCR